jgi:hypothetical protein
MKLRLEARVSSDSPDAVGRVLIAKLGDTSVTRDGSDWIVDAEVESAAPVTRTVNCSASFGGSSGRPDSAPNGRRAARSSDSSITLLGARDRPVGKIGACGREMVRESIPYRSDRPC